MATAEEYVASLTGKRGAASRHDASTAEGYIASLADKGSDRGPPNLLEQGAEALMDVPVLSDILKSTAKLGNAGMNVLGAVTNPDEAGSRLMSAGKSVLDFGGDVLDSVIPGDVIPSATTNADFLHPGTVLDELGVPQDMGRIDIPVLGAFTGRGALEFALGAATDPLVYTRLGGLTRKGSKALGPKGQGLATGITGKAGMEKLARTGRFPSAWAEQASLGQRSLLQFGGKTLIKGEAALEKMELANRWARANVFRPFVTKSGTILDTIPEEAARRVGLEMLHIRKKGQAIRESVIERVKRDLPKGANLDDAIQAAFDKVAISAERGGDPAFRHALAKEMSDEATALRDLEGVTPLQLAEADRLTTQAADLTKPFPKEQLDFARGMVKDYKADGLSTSEAKHAARAVIVHGADPDFAGFGAGMNRIMKYMDDLELDAGLMRTSLHDPGLFYLTRHLTPEGRGALGVTGRRAFVKKFNAWWAGHESVVRRKAIWQGLAIPELEGWMRTHLPKDVVKRLDKLHKDKKLPGRAAFFEQDPMILATVRSERMAKTLTASRSIERVMKDFAVEATAERIDEGWIPMGDLIAPLKLRTHHGPFGRSVTTQQKFRKQFKAHADELEGGSAAARTQEALVGAKTTDLAADPKVYKTRLADADQLVVHPEIAKAIKQVTSRFVDTEAPNLLLRTFDSATRIWKTAVTTYFPEFHARNLFSNVWANYLGDVRNPMVYKQAFDVMHDFHFKGGKRKWKLGEQEFTSLEIIEAMETGRALGFGSTSELTPTKGAGSSLADSPVRSSLYESITEGGVGKAILRESAPTVALQLATGGSAGLMLGPRLGRNAGNIIESWAKVAHVMDKLGKGLDIDHAILSAKKYLFDYGDLTPLERSVFRRVVPFYTWFRKNMPLQIETLFTKPGKIAMLRHAQVAFEDGNGPIDTSVIPEWIRRRWFGASKNDDGAVELMSGLGFGTEDLAFFDRPHMDFLSMLNPVLKAPLQVAMNRDFFRDIPLDRAEVAPKLLGRLPQPFLDLIGYREIKDSRTGEIRIARANPKWLNWLRGFTPTGVLSRFANTAEKLAQSEAPHRANATLKHYTGIRKQTFGPTRQAINMTIARREWVREQLEDLRAKGIVEKSNRFYPERDIDKNTPDARRAKELMSENVKLGGTLHKLYRQEGHEFSEADATSEIRRGRSSGGR